MTLNSISFDQITTILSNSGISLNVIGSYLLQKSGYRSVLSKNTISKLDSIIMAYVG